MIGAYKSPTKYGWEPWIGQEYFSSSVFVYRNDGNSWIQQTELTGNMDGIFDGFGYAISMADDYAVISAFYPGAFEYVGLKILGKVYIYKTDLPS